MEEIIVGDDCSIPANEQSVAGKRGLVGMLFVIKIAGAFAERGLSLPEVAEIARSVSQNTATYGVGLSACALPGKRDNCRLETIVSYRYSKHDTHTHMCVSLYIGQYYYQLQAATFECLFPHRCLSITEISPYFQNISKRYK